MASGGRYSKAGAGSKAVPGSAKTSQFKETNHYVRPKGSHVVSKQVFKGNSPVEAARGGSGRTQPVQVKGALLAATSQKRESGMTTFEKMALVDKGVSKNDLEALKQTAGLDYEKLAHVLSTTRATLINKKGAERFNTTLSERIISLADIYSYGYEVFEDRERFNQWVFRPNQALGGKAPYELLDNQFGREEVKNVIGRIAYGVYS